MREGHLGSRRVSLHERAALGQEMKNLGLEYWGYYPRCYTVTTIFWPYGAAWQACARGLSLNLSYHCLQCKPIFTPILSRNWVNSTGHKLTGPRADKELK